MTEAQRKLLQQVVGEGLKIQDRFSAAPVYATTGKGYLKSEGTAPLSKIKADLKKHAYSWIAERQRPCDRRVAQQHLLHLGNPTVNGKQGSF